MGGAAFWAVVSDMANTSCSASLYFFSVPVMSWAFVRFCAIAGPTMSNALAAALTFFGVGPADTDSVGSFRVSLFSVKPNAGGGVGGGFGPVFTSWGFIIDALGVLALAALP